MSRIIEDEYGNRHEYTGFFSVEFIRDMERGGWPMEHYHSNGFREGPAVRANDERELQTIIRATEVIVDWEGLGMGYIVFPAVSDAGRSL